LFTDILFELYYVKKSCLRKSVHENFMRGTKEGSSEQSGVDEMWTICIGLIRLGSATVKGK